MKFEWKERYRKRILIYICKNLNLRIQIKCLIFAYFFHMESIGGFVFVPQWLLFISYFGMCNVLIEIQTQAFLD